MFARESLTQPVLGNHSKRAMLADDDEAWSVCSMPVRGPGYMHSLGIGCRNRAQELIAGAMLLRHGLTLNVKVHDLVCFSKFAPLRQARTVGISSLDKVRPVSVHSLRHLIIFRLPARFLRI